MKMLEEMIIKEKEDRLESLETQLVPIRVDLKEIANSIDIERNARV